MRPLTSTNNNLVSTAILLLRCMAGLIFFVGSAGKAFGWFGGMGMEATVKSFHDYMHIPAVLAYLSTFTELIGGVLLILGLLTRVAAAALLINMIVATCLVGFANFFGQNGAAYPAFFAINCLAILLAGPMRYSLDAALAGRKEGNVPPQPTRRP